MKQSEDRFTANSPRMIFETIDQDTVVIDTESGVYFNVGGSGSLIFQMLASGVTLPAASTHLATQYAMDAGELQPIVATFAAQLLAEELIVPTEAEAGMTTPPQLPANGHAPFTPPVLNKFTDMADLLLVDPIHEVDERGWPHRA
jgi:hypothetical protein